MKLLIILLLAIISPYILARLTYLDCIHGNPELYSSNCAVGYVGALFAFYIMSLVITILTVIIFRKFIFAKKV